MKAAAVILAAGAGRRLGGVAKALLRDGEGRSFLAAVASRARSPSRIRANALAPKLKTRRFKGKSGVPPPGT